MAVAAIDTGVWVEYINKGGKYHLQARAVIDRLQGSELQAVLPPTILTEVYYVSRRVYEGVLGKAEAARRAQKFYDYIYYHPRVVVHEIDYQIGLRAGEIKCEYGIAISDCFLIALAEEQGVPAVFRHKEEEFTHKLEEDFQVVYLESYA